MKRLKNVLKNIEIEMIIIFKEITNLNISLFIFGLSF